LAIVLGFALVSYVVDTPAAAESKRVYLVKRSRDPVQEPPLVDMTRLCAGANCSGAIAVQ